MSVCEVKTYACMTPQHSDGSRHAFGFWTVIYYHSQAATKTQPNLGDGLNA